MKSGKSFILLGEDVPKRKSMPTLCRPHIYVKNQRVKDVFDEISNISEFVETCVLYYLDHQFVLDELVNKPLTREEVASMICEQFNELLFSQLDNLSAAVVTLNGLSNLSAPLSFTPAAPTPITDNRNLREKSNSILEL